MAVVAESSNGVASGWSTYRSLFTGWWDWNAYGPRGTAHGTARTEDDAMIAAQAERERLR